MSGPAAGFAGSGTVTEDIMDVRFTEIMASERDEIIKSIAAVRTLRLT